MTDQIREQLILFCMSVYTGAVMAFVYDFLRIIRIIKNSKEIWVWLQDLVYWIFFGYVVYALLLKYNYGEIRGYVFLGLVFGMAIYFLTVSRFYVKYMSLLLNKFVNTLLKALKFLCKPIKLGVCWIKKTICKVIKWFIKKKETNKIIEEIPQQDE